MSVTGRLTATEPVITAAILPCRSEYSRQGCGETGHWERKQVLPERRPGAGAVPGAGDGKAGGKLSNVAHGHHELDKHCTEEELLYNSES